MLGRLRFAVLGPVQAWRGEQELPLGPPQQRAVLALLLLRDGAQTSVEEIIDALWSGRAPGSADNAVRSYISRLRGILGPADSVQESVIATVGRGYLLPTGPESFDLAAFRDGVAKAQEAAGAGDHAKAIYLLDEALRLWRGPALAASSGDFVEPQRLRLSKLRLAALESKVVAQVELGAHGDAGLVLDQLIGEHPLNERFRELQMLSLYRYGRQSDALAVYRETQELLAEELGVDPGHRLRSLHERILRADAGLFTGSGGPSSARPGAQADARAPERPGQAHPRAPDSAPPMQLPADLSVFVGRDAEFARVEAMRPADGELPRRTAVVITGMAGVGKTAFAVRWAHRIASRFPDGQIYVNLRGFDPALQMLTPQEALLALFESLGVRPEQLPADVDRQSAYLRSLVAGRRLLIVLDNVRDAEQVRPLLPGGDTSFVIMTSRNQLRGLTVQADAGMIRLDGLPPADAVDLLTRRLSDLPMQPDESVEIVERCGRLPLAIAIVAARVAAAPHIPLAAALSGLRDQQGLLDALMDVDDVVDVRSVFSWSLQALSPKAVDLFRLLALHQALYCDEQAAASLIGLPVPAVRRLLSELVAANLVDASETGHCSSHDLLRLYAVELAADLPPAQRRASIHRLLDHYVATAQNAEFALNPHHRPPEPIEPQPGTAVQQFSNHDQAWGWFVVEHGPLLMAQNLAADEGFDDHVWRLGWALETFMYRRGHWRQLLTVQQAALAAVSRLGDRTLRARVHNSLGRIHLLLDEYDEARRHLTEAISFFEQSGLREQAASGYVSLANLSSDLKDSAEAIRLYKKALELAVDPVLRAGAINNLGNECSIIGDSEQALTLCLQALELWREAGDRHGEAASWDCIAYARHNLGQHAAAAQAYQQAIAGFKELGDNFNQASSLTNLGDCLAAADAPGRARDAWTTALDILTELDHPDAAGVRARLTGLEAS